MKKLFFAAIAAGIALTACVTNEEEVSVGTDAKISFEAPLVQNATRATGVGEIGAIYPTAEMFVVNAKYHETAGVSWGLAQNYMTEVTVKHKGDGGDNYWVPYDTASGSYVDYYWPKKGFLTFLAYSPAGHGTWKPQVVGDNLEVAHVVIQDGTRDLLYSNFVKNRTASENKFPGEDQNSDLQNPYSGVDILFRHALSSIKFKVCLAKPLDGHTSIQLKSIKLENVYSMGDFSWNMNDDNDPVWTNTTAERTFTIVSGSTQNLTTEVTDVNGAEPCITIPQMLNHGTTKVMAHIVYTLNANGSAIEQTRDVDLSALNYGDGVEAKWLPGRRYIYTVNAGLDRIFFAPIVEEWDDEYISYDNSGLGNN